MHVVIVGAGLTGLAVAIGLRNAGHRVTLLERAPELREIGAGIQIPPNASLALRALDVLDAVLEHAVRPKNLSLHSYAARRLSHPTDPIAPLFKLPLDPSFSSQFGAPTLVIHRADFCRILFSTALARGVQIRLSSNVTAVSGGVPSVTLSTGEVVTADLLLGADGERSICRDALLGRPDSPFPNGRLVYRILIPAAEMAKDSLLAPLIELAGVHIWMGPHSHAVGYLLQGVFNMVLFCRGTVDDEVLYGPQKVELDGVLALFQGWEERVQRLLRLANVCLRWSLLETNLLEEWVHPDGKFALLGDSAHACLPFLAHGAAMGVESGTLLALLLAYVTTPAQLPALLTAFNAARLRRTSLVRDYSIESGRMLELTDGEQQKVRDRILGEGMKEPLGNATVKEKGFPFAWADAEFQRVLWRYDVKAEAEDIWRALVADGKV